MNTVAIAGLGATAAALVAGGGLYAGMVPKSQIFGRTVLYAEHADDVFLTYDDGPSPRNTPQVLDVLSRYDAKATFFLIGEHVRRYPELARRIIAEGHTVGNHTQTHPNLMWTSPQRVRQELESCQRSIEDVTGVTPRLFRPPFGARRPDVLHVARSLCLTPVMWTITGGDWKPNRQANELADLVEWVIDKYGGAQNVLLHDASHHDTEKELASREVTIRATEQLLSKMAKHFQFRAIPEDIKITF